MVLTNKQITTITSGTTSHISFQNIENQLQNWQKSIEFLKKEIEFLVGMLELAIQSSKGEQIILLRDFQEKILNFERENLANFSQQLQEQVTQIIVKNESSNLEELRKQQVHLIQEWNELENRFKTLKLLAFEKIEKGISVKIY